MATRAERGPLPHKKGLNTGKKIAAGIMAAIGIGGGVIGGARIAEVGPFESSSPSQKHSREFIGGLPSVIATQTQLVESPTPTLTPEPTPTSTPEISPVDKAIQEGRLEVNGDWEKYFIGVTKQEAQALLDVADKNVNSASEVKIIFPFDPRNKTFAMEEFTVLSSIKSIGNTGYIGFKNLPIGTVLYAPLSGAGNFGMDKYSYSGGIIGAGGINIGLAIPRANGKLLVPPVSPPNKETVGVGIPLFLLGTKENLIYPNYQNYQTYIIIGLLDKGLDKKFFGASFNSFMEKDGKFVFIEEGN